MYSLICYAHTHTQQREPQQPRSLCRSQGPYCPNTMSSQSVFQCPLHFFGLQISYKLGFHWLFILFLRRSARRSSWAQGELGSAPTYLAAIFFPLPFSVLWEKIFEDFFSLLYINLLSTFYFISRNKEWFLMLIPDNYYLFFYWLCYYSCPNFPPLLPSIQQPPLPQAISTPLFISMSHRYKFFGCSISYIVLFTSPWLFCNYLFILLNPLTSSPIPLQPPPIWQP